MEVTQQAKAGDVGSGVDAGLQHGCGGIGVELCHGGDHGFHGGLVCSSYFIGGVHDAGAQWFGQVEDVAGLGAAVAHYAVGVHGAKDGEAVFGFGVLNGVPT